ncbi:chemotaxis protein CheB [Amycolatopsis azurea]|uniref:protein-glutamate methylesterase n=1 Tax=Amycolatopsis azurea DSM 43854 TaxID=1238180 RepID=M2PEU5_9PSEU|nr:chemotaxis protein CheB [Amycolatopsis azurea]EMD22873.1 Chemotaxis response regulator protein-glutamate methylesterase CheB [Amycolatopsis azurea DSM 43854]OOC04243.1 chemotaxis protein CheB [Amycolatopsis azurea DSM 43854]
MRGPDAAYEIVAIGSSAGGVKALIEILGALPADFPVPVVAVQHLDPRRHTILAELLGRRSYLRVKLAEAGDAVERGVVHLAPPDRHLTLASDGRLRLSSGEQVNFVRPSVDLLFESVAAVYGPGTLACVLTGTGSDGAAGAVAVKERGGTVVIEDPETAEFKGMPAAVAKAMTVDLTFSLEEMAGALIGLVKGTRSP